MEAPVVPLPFLVPVVPVAVHNIIGGPQPFSMHLIRMTV